MLSELVIQLSHDPFNPTLNFMVAEEYLKNNQTASAVSFYLRCVEYAPKGSDYGYTSLLRMAQCFDDQKGREYSVTNCLLQALAYDDTKPEAYFFLSRFHELAGNWQESYTFASMGKGWTYDEPLPADVGFHGLIALKFQMAIAAWHIGRKNESLDTLRELVERDDLPEIYQEVIRTNLEKLNASL